MVIFHLAWFPVSAQTKMMDILEFDWYYFLSFYTID